MTAGADYQPVSNAEDAFHLKQNPMDDSVGLRRLETQQNDAERPLIMLPTIAWERAGVCGYDIMPKHQTTTHDSSIYDDYAMPQTRLRRNRAMGKRTHP